MSTIYFSGGIRESPTAVIPFVSRSDSFSRQVFGARFSKDCQGPRAGASVSKLAAQRKAREEVVDIEG